MSAKTVSPNKEYAVTMADFSGGINLWDGDHQMALNESPEMKNLLWRAGMLASRRGQAWLNDTCLGSGHAMYAKLWHGYLFAHIGSGLYAYNSSDGSVTQLASGVPEIRGTFFMYSGSLYYKTRGAYKQISYDGSSFSCSNVIPYVPVIQINSSPLDGSGDLYQSENRYGSRKEVRYNALAGQTRYTLPVTATRVIHVYVDNIMLSSGWSYDIQTATVRFNTAPPVTDPPTNNTVRIVYELADPDARKSIDDCRYALTYGGTGALCVVLAGSEAQPNAYFWNGQNSIAMDPSYFPMEQYQLAGDAEDRITGFGKQQSNLIVFKEGSIGKTAIGTADLNGRLSIDMPYVPVNAVTGCQFPWSIQLVDNNLIWANRQGVYTLLDTSAANENTVQCISRKVNGNDMRPGFCIDAAFADEDSVCSADTGKRYHLTLNGRTWTWDYELSSYADPSWFLLTATDGVAYAVDNDMLYHINPSGQLTKLQDELNDYGSPIFKLLRTATLNFGSYDCLKNVNSVIVTLGAYARTDTVLSYLTDYELRPDLTNLGIVDIVQKPRPGERNIDTFRPAVFRRRTMCRRVLHFALRLFNNNLNEDLEIISAQIFYNLQGRLR